MQTSLHIVGDWVAAAREPKQFLRLEGQGHDPPNTTDFYETVKQFHVKTAR